MPLAWSDSKCCQSRFYFEPPDWYLRYSSLPGEAHLPRYQKDCQVRKCHSLTIAVDLQGIYLMFFSLTSDRLPRLPGRRDSNRRPHLADPSHPENSR